MNNAEFIDGLRKQDPAAARFLNESYVPSVWRFVYFRVDGDAHLAEDIVSESVLALVAAAASEQAIEHPGAWMRTVAQRRIHDHFRAAARVQHLVEQAQQASAVDHEDAAAKHAHQQQRQVVRDAMDKLPENYRFALEWKYVDRLSVKEIARRLETTEKSAESILFRARNALRQQLRGEQPVTRCQSLQAGQDSSDASSGATENSSAGNDTDVPKQPSAVLGSRMASES